MRNVMYPVDKKPYIKPEVKKKVPPDGTEWRCPSCGKDLFGKFKDGQLHIKYREREMMVNGTVSVQCRSCGYVAQLDTRDYGYPVNLVSTLENAPGERLTVSLVEATIQAQELAKRHGIDLKTVKGTGAGGKIVVKDVRRVIESSSQT